MSITATHQTEGRYEGEYHISDGNRGISYDNVRVDGPIAFEPGTVLAKKADGSFAPYDYRGTLTDVDTVDGIAWVGVNLAAGKSANIRATRRLAEVNGKHLVVHAYGVAPNDAQKAAVFAALEVRNIVVR